MRSRLLLVSLAVALVSATVITVAVALERWTLAAAVAALLLGAALVLAADADRQARLVRRRLTKLLRQAPGQRAGRAVETKPTGGPFGVASDQQDGVRGVTTPALGGPDAETPVDTTRADMLGAVRVLQAQYTGRLDRLQATVEQAVTDLRRDKEQGSASGPR